MVASEFGLTVGVHRDYIDKVCGSDGIGIHSVQDFRDLLFSDMACVGHFCGVAWISVFPGSIIKLGWKELC
jgi:hypothetical protein